MEITSRKPKKIIDYRITGQNQIYYLVVWDSNSQEWVQDTQLVGCDKLISQYFTARAHTQNEEFSQEQPPENDKKTRHAARVEDKQAKAPKLAQWSLPGLKNKRRREEGRVPKAPKPPAKSKKYEETELLARKIDQLCRSILQRSAENKLDYLLDYIEGVFMKDGFPYCSVRTLPPARTYLVSIADMEQYFPQVLRQYYANVLLLHQKRLQEAKNALSDDEGRASDESSLQKQQHSRMSEELEIE